MGLNLQAVFCATFTGSPNVRSKKSIITPTDVARCAVNPMVPEKVVRFVSSETVKSTPVRPNFARRNKKRLALVPAPLSSRRHRGQSARFTAREAKDEFPFTDQTDAP